MSSVPKEPKTPELRTLYWRDEILQVMFWIQGEGLGDEVDVPTVARFLGVPAGTVVRYLDHLVTDGYLESAADDRYRLSVKGHADGSRIFAAEFSELTQPGHGECGDDCWCNASPEEAEACHDDRLRAAGQA